MNNVLNSLTFIHSHQLLLPILLLPLLPVPLLPALQELFLNTVNVVVLAGLEAPAVSPLINVKSSMASI